MRSTERGMALLEALIALSIILIVGLSVIARLESASRSVSETLQREHTVRAAGRILAAMTLLKRVDLDRRLGTHPIGEFLVEVQRPELTLYRIGISEATAPQIEALVTLVYRRESPQALGQ